MGAPVCAAEQNVNLLGVCDVALDAIVNIEITAGRRGTWLDFKRDDKMISKCNIHSRQ